MKRAERPKTPCTRLESCTMVSSSLQKGLGALGRQHARLVRNGSRFVCSLDLDDARRRAEPEASRWDYVLGSRHESVGMEVHAAKASEVDVVIRKKQWAETLLKEECGLTVDRWCWIRSPGSRHQLTSLSPQARRLAKSGIGFPKAELE